MTAASRTDVRVGRVLDLLNSWKIGAEQQRIRMARYAVEHGVTAADVRVVDRLLHWNVRTLTRSQYVLGYEVRRAISRDEAMATIQAHTAKEAHTSKALVTFIQRALQLAAEIRAEAAKKKVRR